MSMPDNTELYYLGMVKTVSPVANLATYGGSASAVLFGLTANEFAAVAGVVIALLGLLVNIWFKAKHLDLARKRRQRDSMTDGDE